MAALNERTVSGPVKPGGRGVYAPTLLYRAKKKQERKKETIAPWPIILFKHSIPSVNVKCISPAFIICIITKIKFWAKLK